MILPSRAHEPRLGRFLQPDPAGLEVTSTPTRSPAAARSASTTRGGLSSGDLDWGLVARSAAPPLLLGVGAAIAIGFAVAAGIVSAPFVLVAGAVLLVGGALIAYMVHDRSHPAM